MGETAPLPHHEVTALALPFLMLPAACRDLSATAHMRQTASRTRVDQRIQDLSSTTVTPRSASIAK